MFPLLSPFTFHSLIIIKHGQIVSNIIPNDVCAVLWKESLCDWEGHYLTILHIN